MKTFIVLSLALAVASGTVIRSGYGPGFSVSQRDVSDKAAAQPSPSYGSQSSQAAHHLEGKCEMVYEAVNVDKCEPYVDKVCTTNHEQTCVDVQDRTCRGIVTSGEQRRCFDVTEQICGLKEQISYEVVQAVFTAQKCRRATDRVCDVVFETELKPKVSYQCITVSNPHCVDREEVVNDKTCRTKTIFDCPEQHVKIIRGQGGYDSGYGCKKTYDTRCYDTPRTVSTSHCENRPEKVCEKVTEQVAVPVEKLVCHDEVKKVCELERRNQPKQVKKYTYTKDCKPKPRSVCENAEVQKLVENCVPSSRKRCSLSPVEKCEDVQKRHCRRITEHVPKEKCAPAYPPTEGTKASSYSE